jgi:hypothetical protein
MRSSSIRRLSAWSAVCGVFVGAAMLAAPASSLADGSLTLSVSADQVAAGRPVTYKATGTIPAADVGALNPAELLVLVRPANLGPCGSDEDLDPSETNGNNGASTIGGQMTQIDGPTQSFTYSSTIAGNLRGRGIDTLTAPRGRYLVCGWVDDSGQTLPPVATATASFTLRAPRFTMTVTPPGRPRLRHQNTFSVHGTSEIGAHLTTEVLPACFQLRQTHAGIRCAARPVHNCKATPEAESTYIGENNDVGIQAVTLISREIPRGGFNLKRTVTFGHGWIPARHMVCAWIGITNSDGDPDSNVYLAKSATVTPRP